MKLLEDVSSAVTHRPPPRRTRLTLGVAAVFMLVAAIVGVVLIASGGGSDEPAGGGDPRPAGTLADWASGVTDACTTVAAERPIMAQGPEVRLDAGNLAAVDTGTSALVGAVHDVPLPAEEAEQAQANAVVVSGDQAAQAWTALTGSTAEVTPEQLTQAADLTTAFVAGLTQLGVNCTPIG